jgi:hypothetical protein
MSETLHVQISELRGDMPDVPYAPGIDHAALVAGDVNPVFVTLPLLETGAVSRHGRRYGEAAVRAVVEQVNANKPGGILGHMSNAERSTRFDLPSLMWVGATYQDGKAWGKAYIPPYADNVRQYVVKSKARRAKIATSIYGSAVMDGADVRSLELESIDLADPTRAGVGAAVAEPIITSEMSDSQEGDMPEGTSELISELRGERDTARQQTQTLQTQINEMQGRIGELEPHAAVVTAIREMIPSGDIVQTIREMQTAFAEVQRLRLAEQIDTAVTTALGDIAQNERGAVLIREMVGPVENADAATARVKHLLTTDHVQAMLKALVSEMGGPGAIVGGQGQGQTDQRQQMADNAEQFAQQYGINIRQ